MCKRVNNNVGGVMDAARERSSSRCMTAKQQRNPAHGFPIQIRMPDGETAHHHFNPSLKPNGGPEQVSVIYLNHNN